MVIATSLGKIMGRVVSMSDDRREMISEWHLYISLETSAMLNEGDVTGFNGEKSIRVTLDQHGTVQNRYYMKYTTSGFWIFFSNIDGDGYPRHM